MRLDLSRLLPTLPDPSGTCFPHLPALARDLPKTPLPNPCFPPGLKRRTRRVLERPGPVRRTPRD
jgi:hypothetical protein